MTHLTNACNLFFNGILSLYFPRVNKFDARLINLGCCKLFSDSLSESESYRDIENSIYYIRFSKIRDKIIVFNLNIILPDQILRVLVLSPALFFVI